MVFPVLVQSQVFKVDRVNLFLAETDFADFCFCLTHPIETNLLNRTNVRLKIKQQNGFSLGHFGPQQLP